MKSFFDYSSHYMWVVSTTLIRLRNTKIPHLKSFSQFEFIIHHLIKRTILLLVLLTLLQTTLTFRTWGSCCRYSFGHREVKFNIKQQVLR